MMKLKYLPGAPKLNGFFKMDSPKIRKDWSGGFEEKAPTKELVCIMDWSSFPIFPPILSSSYELSMDECS